MLLISLAELGPSRCRRGCQGRLEWRGTQGTGGNGKPRAPLISSTLCSFTFLISENRPGRIAYLGQVDAHPPALASIASFSIGFASRRRRRRLQVRAAAAPAIGMGPGAAGTERVTGPSAKLPPRGHLDQHRIRSQQGQQRAGAAGGDS